MKYLNPIISFIFALILLSSPVFSKKNVPDFQKVNLPFELHRFALKNGLKVWCQPRSDCKSVVLFFVIRTGSRYEVAANNGVSHFVEHMLFTGTRRWSENEIKNVITKRGGRYNGWTGEEATTYYAEVSARDLDIAMDWATEIVFHSTFPKEKIDKERKVIFQERWGKYGWIINTLDALGFGYELEREIKCLIFPNSTLTLSIIGEDKSLEDINRDVLIKHYQQFYIPNNAVLIVVGNLNPKKVLEKSNIYFGDLHKSKPIELPKTPILPDNGPHKAIVRGPLLTDQCRLMMGARTIGRKHPDQWALKVLSEMLNNSLTEEIRYKRGLVYGLNVCSYCFSDTGYFEIYTRSESKDRILIQNIIEKQLEKIIKGNIEKEKLAEAKTALKGRFILSIEDNFTRASWLQKWALVLTDDEVVPDYESMIDRVTSKDLSRVVNKYFTSQYRFIGMHIPILTVKSGAVILGFFVLILFIGILYIKWRKKKYKNRIRQTSVINT